MPSSDFINFALRPNKSVERKLVFESLNVLGRTFKLPEYLYLGLGSVWFVDFLLAHKQVGINELVSFEKSSRLYSRAEFNKPFNCIEVRRGQSSQLIPAMNGRISDSKILAWLDYDSTLFHSCAFEDIELLCEVVRSGSIVIVTVNADVHRLQSAAEIDTGLLDEVETLLSLDEISDEDKIEMIQEELEGRKTNLGARAAYLQKNIGDYLPEFSNLDLTSRNFPRLLATAVFNKFEDALITTGREDKSFVPIYNIKYKDTSQMLTFGGMICDSSDQARLDESEVWKLDYINGMDQELIDVPPLTQKEKLALDQLLPTDQDLTRERVGTELDIQLTENQLKSYNKYYKHYPVYGELQF
jgi:hypothetical protein